MKRAKEERRSRGKGVEKEKARAVQTRANNSMARQVNVKMIYAVLL